MGNPHAVVFIDKKPADFPVCEVGPLFENNEFFPERTNTEFAYVEDRRTIWMRVWERGTGETLACGTGTCATVMAAILNGLVDAGEKITVHLLGGDLLIEWSGNENDTYFSDDIVYKVNNLLNCGSILRLLDKVKMHNEIFPDTFYQLYAFTGFDDRTIMPILKQDFIKDASPTPQIAIDTYMAALGFTREEAIGRYSNAAYTVWDLIPRNVLRDQDGDIFVVDAEIKRN